ncbi:MAG TPA: thioredoxin family protein [Melioribacteraceae bacterium]|nr:thioredoxin family protein [Melioribacteraceae bacterium]
MIEKKLLNRIEQSGISYKNFMELTQNKIDDKTFRNNEKYDVTKLNLQRSNRIYRTYNVNEELKNSILKIDTPHIWMVITEDWCGDSAQNLPYISKIAEMNPLIELKIILRDSNLDIMDLYLTDGNSRSIPKLVAFDKDGDEIFQWGPRPKSAQKKVEDGKRSGLTKDEYLANLHSWYAENKGKDLEGEFLELLTKINFPLHS